MAAKQPEQLEPRPFEVASDGVRLAGEEVGEGPPIVLLHGLTATRRYVLHGSLTLARRGYRLITYDARGHGESSPAPEDEGYGYEELVRDLAAVLADRCPGERPVLGGHSMGCHTAVAYALDHADEVAALVLAGPVTLGIPASDESLAAWDRLADGLERGGLEGFMGAYEADLGVDPSWRETALRITRERMERHRHPEAVARALRRGPSFAAVRGPGGARDARTCPPSWWRATTRPTRAIRTRSPRPGPSACPTPDSSARNPASPRSPGREAASRG